MCNSNLKLVESTLASFLIEENRVSHFYPKVHERLQRQVQAPRHQIPKVVEKPRIFHRNQEKVRPYLQYPASYSI